MSFSDFLDNITDPYAVTSLVTELFDITKEFTEEVVDICKNEGVEVLKATPAAVKEIADITIPLVKPTPFNVARSAHTLNKVINDFKD